ncbi:MAG: ATP-binding protein [Trueperaceae bacterium]|nr:ATP-binding protein [Trueperaceae bacterium]HRQ09563.1 ATP-binding protein [Trueperaceae bacterium]
MRRLSAKLVLALVGVTLLTITLIAVTQVRSITRENLTLPLGERAQLSPGEVARRFLGNGRLIIGEGWTAVVAPRPGGMGARAQAPHADGLPDSPQIGVSRAALLAMVRDSLEQRTVSLVGSSIIALLVAVALALALARVIARPVESVTRAAGLVAAGDLSVRIPTPGAAGPNASETTRLAHSFNVMADSLERMEADRRAMVADVAHELRTPLTIMRGRLEAMEDGVVDVSLDEVRDLHTQVLALTRLVEDLRVLSLVDSGKLSLQRSQFDLLELARGVASSAQVQGDAKDVKLHVHGAGPVLVDADRDRMRQVMLNLLDNAIRYSPEGGRVTLDVHLRAAGPGFTVKDEGPGVPPGSEKRIFERFARADASRGRAGGGSGLGLAIVSSIVELHGGSVTVANAPEGGAVFEVRL